MLFSSVTFLYYFLPIVLAVYFLVPVRRKPSRDSSNSSGVPARGDSLRGRNWVIIAASVVFYIWGEPVYVILLIGQTVAGYFFGLLIERGKNLNNKKMMKSALTAAIAVHIGCLGFFKYSDFFISNVNNLLGSQVALLGLALPIGISFYTFQILSYEIDLYDGKIKVQKSLPAFTTYVTFFPALVAGPIIRYANIEDQLTTRTHSWEDFRIGVRRFTFGLAKKVLLSNTLASLAATYKAAEAGWATSGGADATAAAGAESVALYTWVYAIAYTFHIYFDFSGYSDMAIGIARMFGFRLLENFNFPYIAASITDFWRRWHISMSFWFRDYVYIRLGGNRVPPARRLFNILFVWFITGFWHGAGWNFIFWGMYYAAILLVEKYILARFLGLDASNSASSSRIGTNSGYGNSSGISSSIVQSRGFGPRIAMMLLQFTRHFYVMIIVVVGWVFFDAATLPEAAGRLAVMFGGADLTTSPEALYYLRSYLVPLIVCAIGATRLPASLAIRIAGTARGKKVIAVLEPIYIAALLIVVTAYLVDGSFNPFIYFRF